MVDVLGDSAGLLANAFVSRLERHRPGNQGGELADRLIADESLRIMLFGPFAIRPVTVRAKLLVNLLAGARFGPLGRDRRPTNQQTQANIAAQRQHGRLEHREGSKVGGHS